MILSVRTDNPEAEIGLFDSKTGNQLSYHKWLADRRLAKELLQVVHDQLAVQKVDWENVEGVVVYAGPGSFTGLRIGITVANTLAYAQKAPIVSATGDDWLQKGVARILKGETDTIVLPEYGAEANITLPKK